MKKTFRRRFYPSNMDEPEEFYYPISERIFYAECYALLNPDLQDEEKMEAFGNFEEVEFDSYEQRMSIMLEFGINDIGTMIDKVITVDRCFTKLLKSMEPLGALALVRMQIDNLKHLYAEVKYPGKILYRIYDEGWELNEIEINGKRIRPMDLIRELDEKYGRIHDMWKTYCKYIHPSQNQKGVSIASYYSYLRMREVPTKKAIKYFSWDMVYVNMLITSLLFQRLDELLVIVKEKHKYREYLKRIKNG